MDNIFYAMNSHQIIENSETNITIIKEENMDEKPGTDLSTVPNVQETYIECDWSNLNTIKEENVDEKPDIDLITEPNVEETYIECDLSNLNIKKEEDVDNNQFIELNIEPNAQEAYAECEVSNVNIKEEEDLDEKPFMDMSIKPNFQELNIDCNLSNVEFTYTPEENTENVLSELKIKKEKNEDVDFDEVLSNEYSFTEEFNSSDQSDEEPELFTCAVCTKSFKTKTSLKS